MKFTITKDNLKYAINFANLAISTTDKDVITSGVLFDVKVNGSSLLATDKNMFSKQNITLTEVGEDFKVLVSGKKISEICQEFPDGELTFNYNSDDGVLEVQGVSGIISLTAYNADEYPDFTVYFTDEVLGEGIDYISKDLDMALNFVTPFVKDDDRRPDLALTELRNNIFLSSDGNKFAMYNNIKLSGDIKIPFYALSSLNKAIPLMVALEDDPIKVYETSNHFIFYNEHKYFGYIKTDVIFPKVESKIMGTNPDIVIKLDREILIQIIKRLKIALDDEGSFINFKLSDLKLKCAVYNSRGAESYEVLSVILDSGGGNIEFAVAYDDLYKVLQLYSNSVLVWKIVKDKFIEIVDMSADYKATAVIPMKI